MSKIIPHRFLQVHKFKWKSMTVYNITTKAHVSPQTQSKAPKCPKQYHIDFCESTNLNKNPWFFKTLP
jgi:hypothetical protein